MDCILGTCINKRNGYSYRRYEGRHVRSHRVAYVVANNLTLDDITGQIVRHICDNRACVNPEHLILGTHQDNMDDMTSRGRSAKGTGIANSVLSDEQVRFIRANYIPRSKMWGTVALGKLLGVSHRTVQSVTSGLRWAHVK